MQMISMLFLGGYVLLVLPPEPLVWSDASVLIAKFATFQNPSATKNMFKQKSMSQQKDDT